MKANFYKILFGLLLFPAVVLASEFIPGKYTEQKKVRKEFTVSANDLLKLDNSYGNIDIITWDQNKIEIEVVITTSGNDEEKVKKRLEEIRIQFNQSPGQVSAVTLLQETERSLWNMIFEGFNNVNMEISYKVKAPVTNNMNISNDYGGISLNELKGNANISCDYGRLLIGALRGNDNFISFDYTNDSKFDYINRAKIVADYSEFNIEEAGTIDLAADYTEASISKVRNIRFRNDYGSLEIEKVKHINGQGDYLDLELGLVYSTADLEMDYGSLSVQKLMADFERFDGKSDYTSMEIGYDPEASFEFEIRTSYGDVEGIQGAGFEVNKNIQDGSDKFIHGKYGTGNPGGSIRISTEYGDVEFSQRN